MLADLLANYVWRSIGAVRRWPVRLARSHLIQAAYSLSIRIAPGLRSR